MTSENPIARKIVKGQKIDGPLPVNYTTLSSSMGVEILEKNILNVQTGRRFLQGIPVTQQSLTGLAFLVPDQAIEAFDRDSDRCKELHDELKNELAQRTTNNLAREEFFENAGAIIGSAFTRLVAGADVRFNLIRDLIRNRFPRLVTAAAISGNQLTITDPELIGFNEFIRDFDPAPFQTIRSQIYYWYAPFYIKMLFAMLKLDDQFTSGQFPSISNVVDGLIRDATQEAILTNSSTWDGIRFTYRDDPEDLNDVATAFTILGLFIDRWRKLYLRDPCREAEQTISRFLQDGYYLEIVAEGLSDDQLLVNNFTGSVTNFSLQTPLAVDDCAVEDLTSNITTGIETATAEGVYQLYVDPDGSTPKFPQGSTRTEWPPVEMNFNAFWGTALAHERFTQIKFNTTYYGNLNSKNKTGFPRYAGLSIPTYQASSFVNLFTGLDAERSIYPHIVRMIESPDIQMGDPEFDVADYRLNWNYYDAERGWVSDDGIFSLAQTDLSQHLHHLQAQLPAEADIFDVIEDTPAQQEAVNRGLDNNEQEDYQDLDELVNPPPACPPFIDRIRALLADEVNHNLAEDVINAQFNSPQGLFTGLITGKVEYTEPLFYKIIRERLMESDEGGNIGHILTQLDEQKKDAPIFGGQPIFHANKAGKNYFTFEDRFVDYGDKYQYDIDAYVVVMTAEYEAIPMTRSQVDCIPNVNIGDIEERLGEGVSYSLFAFKPKFYIVNIPYVHREYQGFIEPGVYNTTRLAVALPPVHIVDRPPIAPGVDIVPYYGVANKMLFMFDYQTDKVIDKYIHLTSGEKNDFEAIHRRQKKTICDLCEGSIEFASEGEDIRAIQIFRTTSVPEILSENNPSQLYRDAFGSEPYKEIDATQGTSFVDDIEPNTKYFYMFRATDKNGHVSNPSHIYRVEMVQEDGLIFPIIELYTPEKTKPGVKYRKMAKHLEIKPSLLMAEPNWSADDDNNISWKIGARKENIFGNTGGNNGRKFLIRLTSIDTGRKIDIKVRFGKETNKVEATEDRDLGE